MVPIISTCAARRRIDAVISSNIGVINLHCRTLIVSIKTFIKTIIIVIVKFIDNIVSIIEELKKAQVINIPPPILRVGGNVWFNLLNLLIPVKVADGYRTSAAARGE